MIVQLLNVRGAFLHIFEPQPSDDPKKPAKFNGAFLFPDANPEVVVRVEGGPSRRAKLQDCLVEVAKAKWGAKTDVILSGIKANNGLCLKNGNTKPEYEGYPGNYFVNANNAKRPTVIDADKTPLTAAEGKIYSGCYLNVSVELWAQDNKFGKKINASLRGLQFVKDGDAFAGGSSSADADEFDLAEGADAEGALV